MLLPSAMSGDVGPNRKMDAMHMLMDGRKESTNVMVAAQFLATTLPAALMNAIYFARICMLGDHTKKLAKLDAISTRN